MSYPLLNPPDWAELNWQWQQHGRTLVKLADDPQTSYSLSGRLYLSDSGWLLLSVPNAMVRGAFEALHEPGTELPPDFNAHISVARAEEVEKIGGGPRISERGKNFLYNVGPLRTVKPLGWSGISRVWFFSVTSPELQALRRSYGLPSLPTTTGGKELPFHITVAIRRTNVLQNSDVSKAAEAARPYVCSSCGQSDCGCAGAVTWVRQKSGQVLAASEIFDLEPIF